MKQDQREPDYSTNVPHGEGANETTGHVDIERETADRENVPVERERQHHEQSEESIERAKERVERDNIRIVMKNEEPPSTKRTGELPKVTTVDRLNDLLRGELASVETYQLALKSVHEEELSSTLRQICESHERRVDLLRTKIRDFGGDPANSSGVWGAFARIVQRGADLLGEKAAIAALEEGEDQGKKRYARDLDELSQPAREFVLTELSPEQRRTHDLARSLQKYVKAA